jgi:hypothetical protein
MAGRRQRARRAAAKKVRLLQYEEESAERRAREAIVRDNIRQTKAMTPEQREEARIQQKADAAYKNTLAGVPGGRGRGSGSYQGAHTMIGPHTPEWFGWGDEE